MTELFQSHDKIISFELKDFNFVINTFSFGVNCFKYDQKILSTWQNYFHNFVFEFVKISILFSIERRNFERIRNIKINTCIPKKHSLKSRIPHRRRHRLMLYWVRVAFKLFVNKCYSKKSKIKINKKHTRAREVYASWELEPCTLSSSLSGLPRCLSCIICKETSRAVVTVVIDGDGGSVLDASTWRWYGPLALLWWSSLLTDIDRSLSSP